MSIYTATPAPPRGGEAVRWVRTVLAGHTPLQGSTRLGGTDRVVPHQQAVQTDRYLVVRARRELGGRPSNLSGLTWPRIHVMSECSEDLFADFDDICSWHETIHQVVLEALAGKEPAVDTGAAVGPLRRVTEPEDEPLYAANTQTYYCLAEYSCALAHN